MHASGQPAAGNKEVNTHGIVPRTRRKKLLNCFVCSTQSGEPPSSSFTVGYFNRIEGNTLTGVSHESLVGGAGTGTSIETPDAYAYHIYGLRLKSNRLTGVLPTPTPTGDTEAPDINGLYAVSINRVQKITRNVILGVNIEGNSVKDLDRGISLGGTGYPTIPVWTALSNPASYGIVIKGNTFQNVTQKVVDPGTTGTVYYQGNGH